MSNDLPSVGTKARIQGTAMNESGTPCLCGDKTTWHAECYRRAALAEHLRDVPMGTA